MSPHVSRDGPRRGNASKDRGLQSRIKPQARALQEQFYTDSSNFVVELVPVSCWFHEAKMTTPERRPGKQNRTR